MGDVYPLAIQFVAERSIVTHRARLDEAPGVFAALADEAPGYGKALLDLRRS